ncbi:MAG: acyltransferase [Tidjanibacter sp.]|nr:acyltransferase [Tidjanibacter sp.]
MNSRYHFIDNLRWVTVVLVLIYHIFYNYNAQGVFGGLGSFCAEGQWQDTICTALYPWFMTLMFILAGASSRYALLHRSVEEFRKERVRKLLLPVTVGLFVFGWVLGVVNVTAGGGWALMPADMPLFVKYLIACGSGTGHLWFIQDLLGFSLLLLLVRKVSDAERVDAWLLKLSERNLWLVLVTVLPLLWGVSQTHIDNPTAAQGLLNLYRPVYYFVTFLLGYYLFSSERVHNFLAKMWAWLVALAVVAGVGFCWVFYGKDYTAPDVLQGLLCNLYCWSMTLAMMGIFKRWADKTSKFTNYMSRSSFGIYIVHMAVCSWACWLLKGSALPLWAIYALALMATLLGSVATYEILHRIPFLRWAIFGIKKRR